MGDGTIVPKLRSSTFVSVSGMSRSTLPCPVALLAAEAGAAVTKTAAIAAAMTNLRITTRHTPHALRLRRRVSPSRSHHALNMHGSSKIYLNVQAFQRIRDIERSRR